MKQYLKGGKGDKLSLNNVNKEQLKIGIKHELEHTNNPKIAAEIAIDHLSEDPYYYTKLKKAGINEMSIKLKQLYLTEMNQKIVTMMKARWKQENPNLDNEQMDYYIQRFEQLKNNPKITNKDITRYTWNDLEHLVDSFPVKLGKEFNKNSATTDGDLVYDKNNLKIFSGKTMRQCITYAENEKYSWCISRTNAASNLYTNYRFGYNPRSFYFVFDKDKTDQKSGGSFIDPLHAVVIHAQEDGGYGFTNANNTGDYNSLSWEKLGSHIRSFSKGSELWEKLKGLESIFKYIKPTEEEAEAAMLKDKHFSEQQFADLSYRLKTAYINLGKELSENSFNILDKDLKNLYINQGHVIPFNLIKDDSSLIKRFITIQIRDKNPINKNYLPFFTPEQKQWFYKNILFDKNTESQYLNFELIEKNFPEQVDKYINYKLDNLDFISEDIIKKMSSNQQIRYSYYNIMFINTKIESGVDSKYKTDTYFALSNLFTLKQYKNFPYKKEFEKLIIENIDKGLDFINFMPPYIINNNNLYLILEDKYNIYNLIDSNGNILEKGDEYDLNPSYEENIMKNIDFVLKIGSSTINNKNLNSLKETVITFQKRAGLIK